jgi:hypothetical protein
MCVYTNTHTHNIALTAAAEDATGHCLALSEEGGGGAGRKVRIRHFEWVWVRV